MWTLVIITLVTAQPGSTGSQFRGGVATTTTLLEFTDQDKCNTAANTLAVQSDTFPSGRVTYVGAIYRIIAKCVAR
jgi:hypothetical protein